MHTQVQSRSFSGDWRDFETKIEISHPFQLPIFKVLFDMVALKIIYYQGNHNMLF